MGLICANATEFSVRRYARGKDPWMFLRQNRKIGENKKWKFSFFPVENNSMLISFGNKLVTLLPKVFDFGENLLMRTQHLGYRWVPLNSKLKYQVNLLRINPVSTQVGSLTRERQECDFWKYFGQRPISTSAFSDQAGPTCTRWVRDFQYVSITARISLQ